MAWTPYHFAKRPVPVSSSASLAKRPHLESGTETHPGGKQSAGGSVSVSSADVRRKGGQGHSDLQFFRLVCLPIFLDQWRSITSNKFVLNVVQGHHLQLRSHPPLFCNFWQSNVKAAAAHYPIIQKEVDDLLSKGAIKLSSGGVGFYSGVFVVPKHTGGLWPILNLKQFNHYLHIV